MFRCRGHSFPILLSLILGRALQNGPERSRARRFGAAQRTLDGEDRSETVYDEGKEELQLDSISEAQQAKRLHLHVATIVLPRKKRAVRSKPQTRISYLRAVSGEFLE